jgi:DNA gyrase subunit A
MYKLRCFEVPEGSKQSRGVNIVNLLPLGEGEKIAAMLKTPDFSEGKFVVMVTKNGKIKRTSLAAYKNVRKNGLIAIGLDEGDEIAGVSLTDGCAQLMIATRQGMIIRLDENAARRLSRTAHGVRAIRLRTGDYVVSMARVREGAAVLTVTDKGNGRRVATDSYRMQNRGGYGSLNYKVSEEKGYVCGIKVVDETDDIILVSSDGVIIRIRARDVRVMGRYATGVRLMRVSGDVSVVAFARAEHDDSAEIAAVEEPAEEELQAELEAAAAEEKNEVVPPDPPADADFDEDAEDMEETGDEDEDESPNAQETDDSEQLSFK